MGGSALPLFRRCQAEARSLWRALRRCGESSKGAQEAFRTLKTLNIIQVHPGFARACGFYCLTKIAAEQAGEAAGPSARPAGAKEPFHSWEEAMKVAKVHTMHPKDKNDYHHPGVAVDFDYYPLPRQWAELEPARCSAQALAACPAKARTILRTVQY